MRINISNLNIDTEFIKDMKDTEKGKVVSETVDFINAFVWLLERNGMHEGMAYENFFASMKEIRNHVKNNPFYKWV